MAKYYARGQVDDRSRRRSCERNNEEKAMSCNMECGVLHIQPLVQLKASDTSRQRLDILSYAPIRTLTPYVHYDSDT